MTTKKCGVTAQDSPCLVEPEPTADIGKTINGRYQLLNLIGAGSYGYVYEAQDKRLHKRVAVKILRAEYCQWPDKVKRFERETMAARELNHPGICKIMSCGTLRDGRPFIVMELVRGESMAQMLDRRRRLNAAEAIDIFVQICDALAVAHDAGIVHRDLNPRNIIIRHDGSPVIVDFGLAKLDDALVSSSLTKSGQAVGTPFYMSPEQCLGLDTDGRSDVYALGCMLYEVLSGHVPFIGETPLAVMYSQMLHEPPPFETLRCIPAHLETAVMRALEKDPAKRPQNVRQLADELTRPQKFKLTCHKIAVTCRRNRRKHACIAAVAAIIVFAFQLGTISDRGRVTAQTEPKLDRSKLSLACKSGSMPRRAHKVKAHGKRYAK